MRDILLTLLVFGSLPFILKRPYIGVLVWSWLSYMNPHRLTWGFAYDIPFAQIVAITTLLAFLFEKNKRGIPVNSTTVCWILFLLWMGITTINAVYFERAYEYYLGILKIQLVTFLTLILLTDKKRIDALIWVIILSIGYFSIKGGMFTILTGGSWRVYGPPDSMISENNALALATLMVIPLMYYLWKITRNKWVRRFLLAAMILSFASALGSQSRGALVALLIVAFYFWWLSKSKIISGTVLAVILSVGLVAMPESWSERMRTTINYEEDESATSRIDAWSYSINIANDNLTGGGFRSLSKATYAIYAPQATGVFVAHSIYFSVLREHGWIGLLLYLLTLCFVWWSLSYVTKASSQGSDLYILARMIKVSLIAYFSGGAFLSLAYFDLPWHLIALAVLIRQQVDDQKQENILEKNNGSRKFLGPTNSI